MVEQGKAVAEQADGEDRTAGDLAQYLEMSGPALATTAALAGTLGQHLLTAGPPLQQHDELYMKDVLDCLVLLCEISADSAAALLPSGQQTDLGLLGNMLCFAAPGPLASGMHQLISCCIRGRPLPEQRSLAWLLLHEPCNMGQLLAQTLTEYIETPELSEFTATATARQHSNTLVLVHLLCSLLAGEEQHTEVGTAIREALLEAGIQAALQQLQQQWELLMSQQVVLEEAEDSAELELLTSYIVTQCQQCITWLADQVRPNLWVEFDSHAGTLAGWLLLVIRPTARAQGQTL
jgi:hypothetical protein